MGCRIEDRAVVRFVEQQDGVTVGQGRLPGFADSRVAIEQRFVDVSLKYKDTQQPSGAGKRVYARPENQARASDASARNQIRRGQAGENGACGRQNGALEDPVNDSESD